VTTNALKIFAGTTDLIDKVQENMFCGGRTIQSAEDRSQWTLLEQLHQQSILESRGGGKETQA